MLENNAKIGDIITSLSDMQGINQKAELASVIGVPATSDDNVATQITKLQDAKDTLAGKIGVANTMSIQAMADNTVVGKKWASGSDTASGYILTVNGLHFKANIIIAYYTDTNGHTYYQTADDITGVRYVVRSDNNYATCYNKSGIVSDENGFSVHTAAPNVKWNWIAIE